MTMAPIFGAASSKASSLTTSPLAAFMNMAPGFINVKKSAFAIPLVFSSKGTCRVTISDSVRRCSNEQKPSGPSF